MPRRKYRRKRSRKRRKSRKRKFGGRKKFSPVRMLNRTAGTQIRNASRIVPPFKVVKMSVYGEENMETHGGIATFDININNLYNPTGAAPEYWPDGYKEAEAIYDNYLVVGAKVTIKAVQTAAGAPTRIGVITRDPAHTGSTSLGYWQDYVNFPGCRHKILIYGSDKEVTLTQYYSNDKLWGQKWYNQLKNPTITHITPTTGAQFGAAGPGRQAQMRIAVKNIDDSDIGTRAIQITYKIHYTVVCYDPKQVVQSIGL